MQIKEIQETSQTTAGSIGEIAQIISKVNEIGTTISSAVEEQAAATREVSQNINGVTQAADESGQSAQNVLGVAGNLSSQAQDLNGQVDVFLEKVRSM